MSALKSKGLLAICEDHGKPLRSCLMVFMRGRKAVLNKRADWKLNWKLFQRQIFGDPKGCGAGDCGRFPAIFWAKCPCGCDHVERVCRRHRSYRAWCSEVNVPPNGTGTVYQQQVKKT